MKDVNDNGLIDYIEFLAATIETQGQIEEERLHDAFDRFDQDESGYIDKLVSFPFTYIISFIYHLAYASRVS